MKLRIAQSARLAAMSKEYAAKVTRESHSLAARLRVMPDTLTRFVSVQRFRDAEAARMLRINGAQAGRLRAMYEYYLASRGESSLNLLQKPALRPLDLGFRTPPMSDLRPVDRSFHTPPMSSYRPVDNSFHTPPMSDYRPVDNSFHTPPMSDYKP